MQNVARFSDKERKELFAATAAKMGLLFVESFVP